MPARSPDHTAFGEAIRRIREERDITQTKLATLTKLDRSYMSGIERGERNPSLTNILLIARALDVPASVIFTRAEAFSSATRKTPPTETSS
jgi:transcriptional regulator with XRE-family HTH domain